MLRLLLDEHISPKVAEGLRRRDPRVVVHAMANWEQGNVLGQDDDACLTEAARQRLTLVTYDRRTIPLLLKTWAESGRSHGGVIFVDEKSIAPRRCWRISASAAPPAQGVGEMGLEKSNLFSAAVMLELSDVIHSDTKSTNLEERFAATVPIYAGSDHQRAFGSGVVFQHGSHEYPEAPSSGGHG